MLRPSRRNTETVFLAASAIGTIAEAWAEPEWEPSVRDVRFLNEFTIRYRLSKDGISKTSIATPYTYEMLRNLQVRPDVQALLDQARTEITPSAVSGFAQLGKPAQALRLFFSSDYPVAKRLSPRSLFHLWRIAQPSSH